MNFLSKIGGAVARMWSLFVGVFSTPEGQKNMEKALGLAKQLVPMVENLARLTPTRADDELIALFKQYAVPEVEKFIALPREDRGIALLYAGRYIALGAFPLAPRWLIDAAVQLAVLKIKSA